MSFSLKFSMSGYFFLNILINMLNLTYLIRLQSWIGEGVLKAPWH